VQKQIYYCLIKLHLDFNMFTTKILLRHEIEGYRIPQTCVYFRPVFLNRDCIIYEQPVYSSSYALPTRSVPTSNCYQSVILYSRHGGCFAMATRQTHISHTTHFSTLCMGGHIPNNKKQKSI